MGLPRRLECEGSKEFRRAVLSRCLALPASEQCEQSVPYLRGEAGDSRAESSAEGRADPQPAEWAAGVGEGSFGDTLRAGSSLVRACFY